MAKSALPANLHQIWVFGQSYDFYPVTTTVNLGPAGFQNSRHQKTQIVLHSTDGHSSAEEGINYWNVGDHPNNPQPTQSGANFYVERIWTPQANRPAKTGDQADTALVDAVRVIDEDLTANHAGNPIVGAPNIGLNKTSIGIEICCLGVELQNANARDEPCGFLHRRPRDLNRWIRLTRAFEGRTDIQALDDEQYMTLTLLLRHLCINHRIPRQFFGKTYDEIFKHWFYPPPTGYPQQFAALPAARKDALRREQRLNVSIIQNFRGILVHRNLHKDKVCPGVVNRNRLFRGISDEWWLPLQPDRELRPYYSGPFKNPEFTPNADPATTKKSYFRLLPDNSGIAAISGVVYRDADINGLLDTKSYYKIIDVESYYNMVETHEGGVFPMGTNKVWHGGVHFGVKDRNPWVYAAAGGTIVAARVTSNQQTDSHPAFGNQQFVLLKHAVYRETQANAQGSGTHLNYDLAPKLVFSLYMHLGALTNLEAEDEGNPPWFNLWRRANPGANVGMQQDKGGVFSPQIPVLLGDILGIAGKFRGRQMIHFEIISHRNTELTGAPWDDASHRAVDNSQDLICDVPALENFLTSTLHTKLESADPIDAAKVLRKTKAFHKSEWALTGEDQVSTLIPNPQRRSILFPHIKRFSWVAEAIHEYPALADQLGDANGMFWHYHPVTFMQHINQLVLKENRISDESVDYHDATVTLSDDYYLVNFVNFIGGTYAAVNIDNKPIRVTEISQEAGFNAQGGNHVSIGYKFTRADIACGQPGTHQPESTPPQSTRFSLFLLGVLQRIFEYLGSDFKIALSHVCNGHVAANLCVMNDIGSATVHLEGNAVDIQPASATAATCKTLWNAIAAIVDPFNRSDAAHCGMASQADLPDNCGAIRYITTPAAQAPLQVHPQGNVPAAEVAGFTVHIELVSIAAAAAAAGNNVNLRVTFVSLLVANPTPFAGQAQVIASVNGNQIGNVIEHDTGIAESIALDLPTSVSLGQNDRLQFTAAVKAEDLKNNDAVTVTFNRGSSPSWGVGAANAKSDRASFILVYKVEWEQSDFG